MVACKDPQKEALRRQRISEAKKGKKINRTQEHNDKIGLALKGRTITPEWREKLRAAALGRKLSVETKRKMSIARTGKRNGFFR